jgi:hypothetical protein
MNSNNNGTPPTHVNMNEQAQSPKSLPGTSNPLAPLYPTPVLCSHGYIFHPKADDATTMELQMDTNNTTTMMTTTTYSMEIHL